MDCSEKTRCLWKVKIESDYRLYRKFNLLTTTKVAYRYRIPEINDVLAQLGHNKIFSVLDPKSGIHQIPLKLTYLEKIAFSVNNGKNAPAIFQRAINDILRRRARFSDFAGSQENKNTSWKNVSS